MSFNINTLHKPTTMSDNDTVVSINPDVFGTSSSCRSTSGTLTITGGQGIRSIYSEYNNEYNSQAVVILGSSKECYTQDMIDVINKINNIMNKNIPTTGLILVNVTGLQIIKSSEHSLMIIDSRYVYYDTYMISLERNSIIYDRLEKFSTNEWTHKNQYSAWIGAFDNQNYSPSAKIGTVEKMSIAISQTGSDLRFGEFYYNYFTHTMIRGDPHDQIRKLNETILIQQSQIEDLDDRLLRVETMLMSIRF